jgi:anhydro-N-acetylmuramic acid kinase
MRVLGMISGTSHDGIDVAVVDFTADFSLDGDAALAARIEYSASVPYEAGLRARLIAALPPALPGLEAACELDTSIGQAFAAAASDAVAVARPDLICSHGQTVYHWVVDGHARGSLQLGQPSWIAESTGLPVVSDVRAADIAAGGEGAPLVPVLDRMLLEPYRQSGAHAGALNLGGISNMTVCAPGADPVAWDIGPANALIDAVVTAAPATPDTFDRDGALAAAGTVIPALLAELLTEPYYAAPPPKSSGKELFHLGYVREALTRAGMDPDVPDLADVVATLTELTAVTVSRAVAEAGVQVLVAAGGGVRNPVMMRRIAELLPGVEVLATDKLGVPSDVKEAVAFALIGWATAHGLPGNVPSCTGAAGPRVLGRITPAPDGALPQAGPLATWPTALSVVGGTALSIAADTR